MEIFITEDHMADMDEAQLKFVFEQAEKQLKEVLLIGDTVVTRTSTLLTLVSGLLVGLVGYGINRWDGNKVDPLFWSSVMSIIYLLTPVGILCWLIIPTSYSILGAPPKKFFSEVFFNNSVSKENRATLLYANEIINYQARINKNIAKNQIRWKRYTTAFLLIAVSPLAFAIIYLLAELLSHHGACHHCL